MIIPKSPLPILVCLMSFVAVGWTGDSSFSQSATKPNVIFIISDDAGYADFGFAKKGLGLSKDFDEAREIESLTPNLDALASRGVTFSRAYVAANCQPTRAAIVTGGYQQRIGNENVGNNNYDLGETFEGVPDDTNTIWDRMGEIGYTTGAVGKWHLGQLPDQTIDGKFVGGNRPENQGIDEFRGIWHGSRSYTVGTYNKDADNKTNQTSILRQAGQTVTEKYLEDDIAPTGPDGDNPYGDEYITETFGTFAKDFIEDHHDDDDPFFLYQSFTAPHKPWDNKSPDFNDDRIDDELSAPNDLFTKNGNSRDGDDLLYRKQVASLQITMDKQIGEILAKLEDPNGDGNNSDSITDNTMIIFVNDNGGVSGKQDFYDDPANNRADNTADGFGVDGVDNGPFDGFKGSPKDGGIRVPMIIAGAGVTAPGGTIYDAPVHAIDVLPTVYGAGSNGTELGSIDDKVDGVNLLPFINGTNSDNPHDVIVHRWQGSFAVIHQADDGTNWKLVNTQRNPDVTNANFDPTRQYRLYSTNEDQAETNNLINDAANANLVAELKRDLTKHEATFDKGRYAILARYVDGDLNNPNYGQNNAGQYDRLDRIDETLPGRSLREGRNIFDHFVFDPKSGNQKWSTVDGWTAKDNIDNIPNSVLDLDPSDPRYRGLGKTMYTSDSFAGAIVEFGTSDSQSYTADNDLVRQSGGDFMLNKIVLSGSSGGSADRTGTIEGNLLLFTKDLNGAGPQIAIDAMQSANNKFAYSIENDIQLFDDLAITGDGDVDVTISGAISDYYSEAAGFDAASRHNTDAAFGARGLTKQGSSTVTLTGANTYSGDTVVEEGTLALSGNGSISNSSHIVIEEGATLDVQGLSGSKLNLEADQTLSGKGTVKGNLDAVSGSIIAPGSSAGILTVDGDFAFEDDTLLQIEIGAVAGAENVAGVDYDQLQVTGNVNLGMGNPDLEVTLLSPTSEFADGDVFQIVMSGGLSGSFGNVMLQELGGGLEWDTSQLNTLGRLRIISAVPEPGSLSLLALAAGMGFARRRRR